MYAQLMGFKKSSLPQSHQILHRKKIALEERTRDIFSRGHSRSEKRISTAAMTATARTNHFFISRRGQRINSPIQDELRPFSAIDTSRYNKGGSNLSSIKINQRCLTPQSKCQKPLKLTQNKFLRRGTAVDQAIIENILRSKLSEKVSNNIFSYADMTENQQILQIVKAQIPKGLQDVIGCEQMIKMSHIFTGNKFPCSNLTKRVNKKLKQTRIKYNEVGQSQDDGLTLRSIKRW